MAAAEQAYVRAELERRHQRLETALKSPSAEPGLTELLGEVDAALSRMDKGSFGLFAVVAANQVCGDVSGKGVAASMLMSHLHATFRSLADSDLPLDRIVEAANRLFLESTLAGQFATLVVGRASENGSVELVSAGHLPVLHLRQGGVVVEESTGTPLGMFSNARFPAHKIQLDKGESLLIYTDGLTEARDSDGDEYGLKRVREFAFPYRDRDPKTLVAACVENLERFR